MKKSRIMTYEAFAANNGEGDLIKAEDVQKAIENGQQAKARNVEGLKGHDENELLDLIDVDEDGEKAKVTVSDKDGNIGYVDLEDVVELVQKTS